MADIGTGDGLWAYHAAKNNPDNFYLALDTNARPLVKISEKIFRRKEKGGINNLLYLLASVESLPDELNEIVDEVHIYFPWGSLLRGVALGDCIVLERLRRVCRSGATLNIVIGFDPLADKTEFDRLGIPSISLPSLNEHLIRRYHDAGFECVKAKLLKDDEWTELKTSWAQRLRYNRQRIAIRICARVAGGRHS